MTNDEIISKLENITSYLKAIAIIQAKLLSLSESEAKPELLLEKSGLTHKEIGELIGKSRGAVSMSISRANE